MITVDELRAAGALDVPAAWRKSLGAERDLFSGLLWNDDKADDTEPADAEPSDAHGPDADLAADEVQ